MVRICKGYGYRDTRTVTSRYGSLERKWYKISPVSKAAQRATAKYKKENYDQVGVLLPKGTKERIKSTGETINSFINSAVEKELKERGK